jgi:transcriptional regulator with XRE-family HTH domain
MMSNHRDKRKELPEQLSTWWSTQTRFVTKKELAGCLNIHRDSIGDYFSGKRFPKPDIAIRLYELTNIPCLKPDDYNVARVESQESIAEPLPLEKGWRQEERAIVISLKRTECPFCSHGLSELRVCGYCGQRFVRANVPLNESSKPR